MNTNYTAGALVVDRSGSMWNIADDVRGSVEQFINDQKKQDGSKVRMTVAQFDHTYEIINDLEDIESIDAANFAKNYSPRGSTALLDAIGRATIDMQKKIETMSEKPNRVVVAIITDGEENSSTEFNLEKIKGIIQEKTAAGWDFIFLGASLDAIKVAANMGISGNQASSYDTSNFKSCMEALNTKFYNARADKDVSFTDAERDEMAKTASPAA